MPLVEGLQMKYAISKTNLDEKYSHNIIILLPRSQYKKIK